MNIGAMLIGKHQFHATLLLDEEATRAKVLRELHKLVDGLLPGDTAVLYFSGHGARVPAASLVDEWDGVSEALCPVDFSLDDPDTTITDAEVLEIVCRAPQESVVWLILDCCFSGGMASEGWNRNIALGLSGSSDRRTVLAWLYEVVSLGVQTANPVGFLRASRTHPGLGVLAACEPHTVAKEGPFDGFTQGVFTRRLYEALDQPTAKAASVVELLQWVRAQVQAESPLQRPVMEAPFALASRPLFARRA